MHLVTQQPAIAWLVGKRLVHVSCARTQRTIGIAFHRTQPQIRRAPRMPQPHLGLILPVSFHWCRINASREFALFRQFGIHRHVGKFRIHVLHAGHAY